MSNIHEKCKKKQKQPNNNFSPLFHKVQCTFIYVHVLENCEFCLYFYSTNTLFVRFENLVGKSWLRKDQYMYYIMYI